jgi:ATP-dependent Clp protease, protease subunit
MIQYSIDPSIKPRNIADLIQLPHVLTVNSFTEESARSFRREFNDAITTGQTVIPVCIDSYGGQVYSLMSMIDTIKSSPVPVATIVTGKAMSCGAILFSFGTNGFRIMQPNATVMIHEVSRGTWGKIEEIKADVTQAESLNNRVFAMMANNCGKRKESR